MDNFTKAVRFERPDYIPMIFHINAACWHHYPKEALWDLMEEHKLLFPNFKRPSPDWMPYYPLCARADHPYTDPMGCTWYTSDNGITGTVLGHPLADWSAFHTTWNIADPNTSDGLNTVDWNARIDAWNKIKANGGSFRGGLRHGHTFLQLCDLRGYENILCDMMDEEPLLDELIDELSEFNLALVKRYIENGCDSMSYPEDLGMQVGPMLARYVREIYKARISKDNEARARCRYTYTYA